MKRLEQNVFIARIGITFNTTALRRNEPIPKMLFFLDPSTFIVLYENFPEGKRVSIIIPYRYHLHIDVVIMRKLVVPFRLNN